MLSVPQLVMRKAQIIRTSDQIHPRLDGLQTMSRMPTFAREASQALPHGPIEPFNKGGVQLGASPTRLKQVLRLLERSQRHLARDLDETFVLHVFDHGCNTETRPHF